MLAYHLLAVSTTSLLSVVCPTDRTGSITNLSFSFSLHCHPFTLTTLSFHPRLVKSSLSLQAPYLIHLTALYLDLQSNIVYFLNLHLHSSLPLLPTSLHSTFLHYPFSLLSKATCLPTMGSTVSNRDWAKTVDLWNHAIHQHARDEQHALELIAQHMESQGTFVTLRISQKIQVDQSLSIHERRLVTRLPRGVPKAKPISRAGVQTFLDATAKHSLEGQSICSLRINRANAHAIESSKCTPNFLLRVFTLSGGRNYNGWRPTNGFTVDDVFMPSKALTDKA